MKKMPMKKMGAAMKAAAGKLPKGDMKATAGTKMREQTGATKKKPEPDNPIVPRRPAPSGVVRKRLEGKLI